MNKQDLFGGDTVDAALQFGTIAWLQVIQGESLRLLGVLHVVDLILKRRLLGLHVLQLGHDCCEACGLCVGISIACFWVDQGQGRHGRRRRSCCLWGSCPCTGGRSFLLVLQRLVLFAHFIDLLLQLRLFGVYRHVLTQQTIYKLFRDLSSRQLFALRLIFSFNFVLGGVALQDLTEAVAALLCSQEE